MFYGFELGHNAAEATKSIWYAKGEGLVDYSTEETFLGLQEPRQSSKVGWT